MLEPPIPTKFTDVELRAIFEMIEYLEQPNAQTRDTLEYAENLRWAVVCGLTRDLAIEENYIKIDAMVNAFVSDYFTSHLFGDKEKFKVHCKSMVWGVLFQPPLLIGKNQKQRDIVTQITSLRFWNPNDFVLEFCNRLDKIFEFL